MAEIHIGQLIREKMKEEGRSAAWLAKQLYCNRSNIHKIFQKQTIDTDLLFRISKIMKVDYFEFYSDALHVNIE
jgi:plasmid maintenance system antidote protein VapI